MHMKSQKHLQNWLAIQIIRCSYSSDTPNSSMHCSYELLLLHLRPPSLSCKKLQWSIQSLVTEPRLFSKNKHSPFLGGPLPNRFFLATLTILFCSIGSSSHPKPFLLATSSNPRSTTSSFLNIAPSFCHSMFSYNTLPFLVLITDGSLLPSHPAKGFSGMFLLRRESLGKGFVS